MQEFGGEIEAKKQRLENLMTLPVSREEAGARLAGWVEASTQQAVEDLQRSLGFVITNPLNDLKPETRVNLLSSPADGTGGVKQHMLLLFFGDAIKAEIPNVLARLAWPEDTGPPMAERLAEISKLNGEIERLSMRNPLLSSKPLRPASRLNSLAHCHPSSAAARVDSVLEHQSLEQAARRYWRKHPEIREEFRRDFSLYLEFRSRRAGLRQGNDESRYIGAR